MPEVRRTIKIGDTVRWRGGWGTDPAKDVKVKGMLLTTRPREKHDGVKVKEVDINNDVGGNMVCFDLDNGHWAYSEQIEGRVLDSGTVVIPVRTGGWPKRQDAELKRDLRKSLIRLDYWEAEAVSVCLKEWYDQCGPIEDLDGNKVGLTKERYELLIEKLDRLLDLEY